MQGTGGTYRSHVRLLAEVGLLGGMTTAGEEGGRRTDQLLDDMVRDADEYYTSLNEKHVAQTRLGVTVVSLITWFA